MEWSSILHPLHPENIMKLHDSNLATRATFGVLTIVAAGTVTLLFAENEQ